MILNLVFLTVAFVTHYASGQASSCLEEQGTVPSGLVVTKQKNDMDFLLQNPDEDWYISRIRYVES